MISPTSFPPAAARTAHPTMLIIAPPDLRIESEVDAVLGSAEVKRQITTSAPADAPVVRITGTAFLGSIEIKVVDPDAPGFMDKLRRKIRGSSRA